MTRPAGTPAGSAAGTPAGSAAGTPARGGTGTPAGASGSTAAPATAGPGAGVEAPETSTAGQTAETAQTAHPTTPRRRGAPWWLFGLVAAVALAAVVVAALLLTRASDDELRDSALTAAGRYTQSLTSYDARTLEEDVERVQRVSSPEFASEYERTITEVREQIVADQTVSVGTVVAAGVERLEDDRAVVLVAVDQAVTAGGQPTRTEANRVRMTLVRQDGRWLVQDVERL